MGMAKCEVRETAQTGDTSAQESPFSDSRFPKGEARKATDFGLFLTLEVIRAARPPFLFLLSLFAAMVSPDKFLRLCRLERSAEPSAMNRISLS